jgi:hypothetical chaperone protein
MPKALTLAIDFGTSNSLVGAARGDDRIEALPIDPVAKDPSLMRTLLYFVDSRECYFGAQTIPKYVENEMEGRLFRSFKSHLANRSYSGTSVGDRVMSLENLVTTFLIELKKRSEDILGEKAERAIIGKPARYSLDPAVDEFALGRMGRAVEAAGFKEYQFVPEPLAAALDYRRGLKEEKLVLIGDFGGGTSDFTLMRMGPFDYKDSDVLGIDGCPLAGDALDSLFMSQRLNKFFGSEVKYKMSMSANWLSMPPTVTERLNQPAHIVHLKDRATYEFIKEVRKGAPAEKDKKSIDRLFAMIEDQQIFAFFEQIEATKRRLSERDIASFAFDYPEIEVKTDFLREEFDVWSQPTVDKIFASMDECLRKGGVTADKVDLISLTGGSSQVPKIRREFEKRFGPEKLQTRSHFHSVLSGLIESARGFNV